MPNVFNSKINLLLVLLLVAGGFWWLARPTPVPAVTLTTLAGKRIALNKLNGKVVLLSFWATDCPACLQERAILERIYRQFSSRGLRLYAIAMPYDPPNRVMQFVKTHPPSYLVALDPFGRISQAFEVALIPTSILISPDGSLVWRHTGIPDLDRLQSLIENLLHQGD